MTSKAATGLVASQELDQQRQVDSRLHYDVVHGAVTHLVVLLELHSSRQVVGLVRNFVTSDVVVHFVVSQGQ